MKTFAMTLGFFFLLTMNFGYSSNPDKNDQEGPKIEFNKQVHDYGKIERNGDGKSFFVFENTGNAPLVLNKVTSSCGCTTPKWPRNKPLQPGSKDTIVVKYNTRIIGNFHKSVTVHSNAENNSRIRLKIKGKVRR